MQSGDNELVVVANRLPADITVHEDGSITTERSPGGLVSALMPVMQKTSGAWVGWAGRPDTGLEPFEGEGISMWPVDLSAQEVEEYYEGFSNGTLWPLYHDVIVDPEYHRHWWNAYVAINRRFAVAAAQAVAEGGTVWVQDYQLQLVPAVLRHLRPDVRIGFFNHIPFPPVELFAQLPWRKEILRGLLGADLLGFQRPDDAHNFRRACRRILGLASKGRDVQVEGRGSASSTRRVRAEAYPISIDFAAIDELARKPETIRRAAEIRAELGDPQILALGVDRLDYTKGIPHRLKVFGELLADGRLSVPEACMIQVATPSRERVEQYKTLRDEVEVTVGRINGDYGSLGSVAIHYMHQSFPIEELAALYRAADIMLVTSLRDGMNLVAKEYCGARADGDGVLILSEFTGAADEMPQALQINPHDIQDTKEKVMDAVEMPQAERRRRMRALRRRVREHDVARWADDFLFTLATVPPPQRPEGVPSRAPRFAADGPLGGSRPAAGTGTDA